MGAFDRFWKRELLLKKTIEIDEDLYEKIDELSKKTYHTSTNQLINGCIEELLKTKNIKVYEKETNKIPVQHSLLIRESLFKGLEELRERYNLSICKLVNISIKNAIEELENT